MYKKTLKSPWFRISMSTLIILTVSLSIYFKTSPERISRNRNLPEPQIKEFSNSLPMRFEKNEGQAGTHSDYLCRAQSHTMLLSSTGMLLSLPGPAPESSAQKSRDHKASTTIQSAGLLEMRLVGSNAQSEVNGHDELVTRSNFFIGNDPSKWRTNIPNYGRVRYRSVYDGVDLEYYGNQGRLIF